MSNHSVEDIQNDGIVLSRANSRKLIHIPMEQIEAYARECGRTPAEVVSDLAEMVNTGAMGEGWDVSRFYNMPATASAEDESWDVSRFYSMPKSTESQSIRSVH